MGKQKYPNGKLGADDEGELTLAIGDREGVVVIDFFKPVSWIGLPPQEAVHFAQMIINRARLISKEPLTLKIGGAQ